MGLQPWLQSSSSLITGSASSRLGVGLLALSLSVETANAAWLFRPPNTGPQRRTAIPGYGFFDPSQYGGSMLTSVPGTYPEGLGEPLNVIITANSDRDVLQDREDKGGLRNYFQSLGFSSECLGQSLGSKQSANLGDGHGYLNETAVIRWDYGNPYIGTCTETIQGGNHFRYWQQNGPNANSEAVFMALSAEQPISAGHDLIQNGYNLARDWLVGNATQVQFPNPNPLSFQPTPLQISSSVSLASSSSVLSVGSVMSVASVSSISATKSGNFTIALGPSTTPPVATPQSTQSLNAAGGTGFIEEVSGGQYVGTTSANNYTYQTTATYLTGLVGNTSTNINHYQSVPQDGRPAVDGLVAVLVVKIVQRPPGDSAALRVVLSPVMMGVLMTLWTLLLSWS